MAEGSPASPLAKLGLCSGPLRPGVAQSAIGRCRLIIKRIWALLPLRGSVPATTIEVGPVIQQLVGWMIRLLTGTLRHDGDPVHLIWWMLCELWPEGSKASAVTAPITARRRVTELPALVYKRAEFCGNSVRSGGEGEICVHSTFHAIADSIGSTKSVVPRCLLKRGWGAECGNPSMTPALAPS